MKMKKGDLAILIILVIAVAGWFAKDFLVPDQANKIAVIKINSEIYTTLPLVNTNEQKEIELALPDNEYVHVVMEKDRVWVEDASCPDKACVNTGEISKTGQSIVCLPNKTVVYVEGAEQQDIDDVTF